MIKEINFLRLDEINQYLTLDLIEWTHTGLSRSNVIKMNVHFYFYQTFSSGRASIDSNKTLTQSYLTNQTTPDDLDQTLEGAPVRGSVINQSRIDQSQVNLNQTEQEVVDDGIIRPNSRGDGPRRSSSGIDELFSMRTKHIMHESCDTNGA